MKTSFARSLTLAALPFLALAACDQQPTYYRQLPAYQPAQPVYVEPVAPPPAPSMANPAPAIIVASPPPPAVVIVPSAPFAPSPIVAVPSYQARTYTTTRAVTTTERVGAPVRVTTPTTMTAPTVTGPAPTYANKVPPAAPAQIVPTRGTGTLADRAGLMTSFKTSAAPPALPAVRPTAPAPVAPTTPPNFVSPRPVASPPAPSSGSMFGGTRPSPAPAPASGGLFGGSRPAPSAPSSGSFFGSPRPAPAPSGSLYGGSRSSGSPSSFGNTGSRSSFGGRR